LYDGCQILVNKEELSMTNNEKAFACCLGFWFVAGMIGGTVYDAAHPAEGDQAQWVGGGIGSGVGAGVGVLFFICGKLMHSYKERAASQRLATATTPAYDAGQISEGPTVSAEP
jgi:hypothetical protein